MTRCVTAPVKLLIVLNFHFYWYCLSLKANFQKKIFVEIHVLEVSWVSCKCLLTKCFVFVNVII